MADKIRIGIIGAGNIAQSAHIPAYLEQDDVELYAVYDINESRAKEVAEKFGFKHAVRSLDELVGMEELDAVSVCTWNNGHKDAGLLRNAANISSEKPMAMTVEETEAMAEAGVRTMSFS